MQLSDAEWKVMDVVWSQPDVTARDVFDRVHEDTGWAYTTVKTMLDRLAQKGAIEESKQDHRSHYSARVTRDRARVSALRSLVDRAFGGTFGSLVHHLVDREELNEADRELLQKAIAEESKRGERS